MTRPTIRDLADASGVSVSTVNRVLAGTGKVRQATMQRIEDAAAAIGFYGLGTIGHAVERGKETHRLGVLLLSESRRFYKNLGDAIQRAADQHNECRIDLSLGFLDDLAPDKVAARIEELARRNEAIAVVAPQHPIIADAVDQALANGVAVAALIAPLSARGNVSYIGLDNWKVGRVAAWAFDKLVRSPGKVAILIGNHRFRNQELNESGFRSYFRENNSAFTLLEPLSTYESATIAREHIEMLLSDHPDLSGIFISGGGITGALAGLRAMPRRADFVAVGYELFEDTRAALIDGTLSLVISHPMETFARETIATLIRAKKAGPESGALRVALNFDLYTPENI